MSNSKEECELEHLVIPDEEQLAYDITPPLSTVPPSSHTSNKTPSVQSSEQVDGRPLTRNATGLSGITVLSSQSGTNHSKEHRVSITNEKIRSSSERPPRPPPPTIKALNKRVLPASLSNSNVSQLQHHSFLSDVTDVRQMEQALLKLLEDFHSGKLRAFGKDCSMEQMTGIREQQENLARLHFELGAQQDLNGDGLRQGQENMHSLMSKLEKLSMSIEKLHSFSSSVQD